MRKFVYLLLIVPLFAFARPKAERPLIGISCGESKGSAKVKMQYADAISKSGGTPILIPVLTDSVVLRDMLCRLDGLIVTGGEDVAPARYGEAPHEKLGKVNEYRDTHDFMLARIARDIKLPMLGICRGVQLVNVAFGGSLYQDIPSQCPNAYLKHRASVKGEKPMHKVQFEPGSQLSKMFGVTELVTNSTHHQAVKKVAPGFRIVARAVDTTVEGIESTEGLPIWGVQFHPEVMVENGNEVALDFFKSFVRKVKTFKR